MSVAQDVRAGCPSSGRHHFTASARLEHSTAQQNSTAPHSTAPAQIGGDSLWAGHVCSRGLLLKVRPLPSLEAYKARLQCWSRSAAAGSFRQGQHAVMVLLAAGGQVVEG